MADKEKAFYNVILEQRSGDKILVAQTTVPHEYVDMTYPNAVMSEELDDEIMWNTPDNDGRILYAIQVRPIVLNTLLSEEDFDKMKRL